MSKLTKALTAAAGNAGGDNLYVEDVFSTYLYTGTDAAQTITNGIDLSGEGGLVWVKPRSVSGRHVLTDTENGTGTFRDTADTSGGFTSSAYITAFNSDGYSIGTGVSSLPATYASWTFRKAEKFFDVVTYTGNGVAGREIAHNLGSSVGTLIVKRTDSTSSWWTWHKDIGTNYLSLNTTGSQAGGIVWNYTAPTDSVFTVGDDANTNGATYVAYLFASDAGGFGDDGDESIIKCGSYVGDNSATGPIIDLGFEPQWLLIKDSSASANWTIIDNMRGWSEGKYSDQPQLFPNTSGAEDAGLFAQVAGINATGFIAGGQRNNTGNTYIYIAIRRPMKTPESGTEVFSPDLADASVAPLWEAPFPVDLGMYAKRDSSTATFYAATRLTGTGRLSTWDTAAEVTDNGFKWDYMDGWFNNAFTDSQYLGYGFKRATGFMDVVAYSGNSTNPTSINHNLGVVPELMIIKRRSDYRNWLVYHGDLALNEAIVLNLTNAKYTDASTFPSKNHTATQFIVGNNYNVNGSGDTYIAYLFATVAGVSKVGSYTGTGSNVNVDCGFSAGARFILIKRSDSTGDWYVWDSVRGIVAGNDPYLLLNSTAAEVTSTDYIDPLSSGFTVTSSAPAALNASGGSYIFLAIS